MGATSDSCWLCYSALYLGWKPTDEIVAMRARSCKQLFMSALQKARAQYDQQLLRERAATGSAAGSAGMGMRYLEVRPTFVHLLLHASRLHPHLQSHRGFAHLHIYLFAGQASPPCSSSYLGSQCAPCTKQCRCAACTVKTEHMPGLR